MALERIGLGAILTANSKSFERGMNRARESMARMQAKMRAGGAKMATGFRDMAMGLTPLAIAVGVGIKKAADFEKQMAGVGAVSRANAEDLAAMAKEAKRMGIISAFSATQAGEGMEFLARAGAEPQQVIAATAGVMNVAAADAMEMGTAADIVARVVKGMGLEWGEAAHIADVLALASASSNTNVTRLGESFTFGTAAARNLGVELEEVTAVFGVMANAGLKGSLAGTAFSNMMIKMSKPTSAGKAILKEFGVELEHADGSLRKVSEIVSEFSEGMEKIPSVTTRAAKAQEVFGRRGARAYAALATQGPEAINELEKKLRRSSMGIGAAAEMAERRLDNLHGKMTLFKSSMEGLAIGVFGPVLSSFSDSVAGMTSGLNTVLFAIEDINAAFADPKNTAEKMDQALIDHGSLAVKVALGIRDATQMIGNAWKWVTGKVKSFVDFVVSQLGSDGARSFVKWITLIGIFAALIPPIALSFLMVKLVVGGLITFISGLGTVLAAAFWPLLIAVGAIVLAYQMFRRENETLGQTAVRAWNTIRMAALEFWYGTLKPLWEGLKAGFMGAWTAIESSWNSLVATLKAALTEIGQSVFGLTEGFELNWRQVGEVIGAVFGHLIGYTISFIEAVVPVVKVVSEVLIGIVSFIQGAFTRFGTFLGEGIGRFAHAFGLLFEGNILQGLKRLGLAILNNLLNPIRLLVEAVVGLGEAVGISMPKFLTEFVNTGIGETFMEKGKSKSKKPTFKSTPIGEGIRKASGIKTPAGAKKEKGMMDSMMDLLGAKQTASKGGTPRVKTDINLEDKRKLEIQNEMCIDGEAASMASARHQQELQDRAGFKATPWQRRVMAEHGAVVTVKAS